MSERKSVSAFLKVKSIVLESGSFLCIVGNSLTHVPQECVLDVISSYKIIHWMGYGVV